MCVDCTPRHSLHFKSLLGHALGITFGKGDQRAAHPRFVSPGCDMWEARKGLLLSTDAQGDEAALRAQVLARMCKCQLCTDRMRELLPGLPAPAAAAADHDMR